MISIVLRIGLTIFLLSYWFPNRSSLFYIYFGNPEFTTFLFDRWVCVDDHINYIGHLGENEKLEKKGLSNFLLIIVSSATFLHAMVTVNTSKTSAKVMMPLRVTAPAGRHCSQHSQLQALTVLHLFCSVWY